MTPDLFVWAPLTLAWVAIIAVAVFMYVLMDGFDLGIGILFPFAGGHGDRDVMMNSIAPVWDFNETWLVLGGAGLFAAFPIAYATILPAMYLPLLAMLIALIFRGVAFEFRFKAERSRALWDWAFFTGSTLAAFAQGTVLGAFVHGVAVEGRRYVGGMLDWLSPFSLFCGAAVVVGYALLGATWLIWRSEGALQGWAYRMARPLTLGVVAAIAVVSVWTPFVDPRIAARWFSLPNIVFLAPVPIITAALAWGLMRALHRWRERQPFLLAMGLFLLSYLGLAVSLWPWLIPYTTTIWDAAAPPESQRFLLYGMIPLVPVIIFYTVYGYWVFRGKVGGEGYHG
jgi:cytochrome bd ubiquinol oxidase subunit II